MLTSCAPCEHGGRVNGMDALDAVAMAEMVHRGEATPVELVSVAIERIEASNPQLNAVVTTSFDQALTVAANGPRGRFGGVPYLLKDLIVEQEGTPFTEGSRFLRGHRSAFTSELVVRLERAGLIVLGRTNTPEFGMAPACESLLHGPARNPWNVEHSTTRSRCASHSDTN
jgi:amidase